MSSMIILTFVLERMQRDACFLWGHLIERRGLHLVSWKHFCTPKHYGGFGINYLFDQKEALLCKLTTQIVSKPRSLWVQIVSAEY